MENFEKQSSVSGLDISKRTEVKLQTSPEHYAEEAEAWKERLRKVHLDPQIATPEKVAQREAIVETLIEKHYGKTINVENLCQVVNIASNYNKINFYTSNDRERLVKMLETMGTKKGYYTNGENTFVINELDSNWEPVTDQYSVWHLKESEEPKQEQEKEQNWRELSLLERNAEGNLTGILMLGNLKTRVAFELREYFEEEASRAQKREAWFIEDLGNESMLQMMNGVMRCIDDMETLKKPGKQESADLAQYLSWSYYQATEKPIEDTEYKPTTVPLQDLQSLYNGVKGRYESI